MKELEDRRENTSMYSNHFLEGKSVHMSGRQGGEWNNLLPFLSFLSLRKGANVSKIFGKSLLNLLTDFFADEGDFGDCDEGEPGDEMTSTSLIDAALSASVDGAGGTSVPFEDAGGLSEPWSSDNSGLVIVGAGDEGRSDFTGVESAG